MGALVYVYAYNGTQRGGLTRVMKSKFHQIEENNKDTQNTNNSTCRRDNVNQPFPEDLGRYLSYLPA